jgi:DNA mismatch repair protein MutS
MCPAETMNRESKNGSDTPVMRQYRSVKERYPDAVLLFRMGDFYEMFYEDAVTASKVLGIALTSRHKTQENPVPMAGVPHHSVSTYLKRLLEAGYRAAICEQLEEPGKGKAVVARDVVRIITPGVNVDTELLDARESNFLCAVASDDRETLGRSFAVAVADISTGQMMAAPIDDLSTLASEVIRFEPKEVLVPAGHEALAAFIREKVPAAAITPTHTFGQYGDFASAVARIDEVMDRGREAGESCAGRLAPLPAAACAALLEYLSRTQPGQPLPVRRIAVYRPSQFMILDEMTIRHLELTVSTSGDKKGSLLWLVDRTVTPMGSRLLRSWLLSPLMDIGAIRRRQDAVQYFVDDYKVRQEVRALLREMCDIERIVSRCVLKAAAPRELRALADTLLLLPRLLQYFSGSSFMEIIEKGPDVFGSPPQVPGELARLLDGALVADPPASTKEGGIFKRGFHGDLDQLVYLSTSSKEAIAALEKKEKEASGISSLKVKYNKVFGYFIEVTKANLSLVPHDRYIRKQTIANGERYITEELKDLESKILSADERRRSLEAELFADLVAKVAEVEAPLQALAGFVSAVDVSSSLADFAARSGWTRPVVDDGRVIAVRDGRHPVVESLSASEGFVPNDVCLDIDGERVWIITGPNMSGKSTFMRQVALCTILAQAGSFIPASEARIGLCDRIFTRVGASDNLAWGQSTFMVEMTETASILNHATARSLVVLDEIGRGTSTFDGMSIAWATAEYLHDRVGCRTLLATHYHELTGLASMYPHVANYNVSATEYGDKIIFLRKVTKGGSSRSYGIQVARLAGIPGDVIARAREILDRIESGSDRRGALEGPGAKGGSHGPEKTPGQLSLFGAPPGLEKDGRIRKILADLEVEKLTPLEAISLLAHLKTLV